MDNRVVLITLLLCGAGLLTTFSNHPAANAIRHGASTFADFAGTLVAAIANWIERLFFER